MMRCLASSQLGTLLGIVELHATSPSASFSSFCWEECWQLTLLWVALRVTERLLKCGLLWAMCVIEQPNSRLAALKMVDI